MMLKELPYYMAKVNLSGVNYKQETEVIPIYAVHT